MPKTRVELSSAGMRALLNDPGVRADLTRRMDAVAARARQAAPVDTGAYRDSIHVEQHTTPSRAVVRVVAGTDHGMVVESKTGNLARALDAAGGA